MSVETAFAIDRLARSPLTVSARRLSSMLMVDRWGVIGAALVAIIVLLVALPLVWALAGTAIVVAGAGVATRRLGKHMVASQLPMRTVPERIRRIVDAPVVVFGQHRHDPRWQPLADGGLYVNSGTWLPATRPGLRRSFTHVSIEPRADGGAPVVELRQWREGASRVFEPE